MTTLREKIASLPKDSQDRIAKRSAEMIAEEASLRDMRHALGLTQEQLAKTLKIKQSGLSALEKRTDLYLSTLRNFVSAMGGNLVLRAEFKNGKVFVIKGLEPLDITATSKDELAKTNGELEAVD